MPIPSNWYQEGQRRDTVAWFARQVEVPNTPARYGIEFEGVDYQADVYWDGVRIGGHQGYFSPFRVKLPERAGGVHTLAVRVESPRERPEAWSLRKTLIKGVLAHHDTRPGNAWSTRGQAANTGGIWGHVNLRRVGGSFIDPPRVTTSALSTDAAELSIYVSLDGPASLPGRFEIYDPQSKRVATGPLSRDGDHAEAKVRIPRPALWWPRGLGVPALYTIVVSVAAGRGAVDQRSARFGIRTISQDGARRLVLNGRPIFLRGTNYIATQYFAAFPQTTLLRDFALMEAAHINTVRVHAHISLPALYDLADERGMLLFQDFPLQWGYDDSQAFADEAARQVREMLALLHNHPSIVFWTGMNEAPFSSDWMKWKYPDYDPNQNRRLEAAVKAELERDASRPHEGNAHPAHHAWAGWYDGTYKGFLRPQSHALITEFGAQAVPRVSTLRTFLKPAALWPIEPNLKLWEYHDFQLHELRDIAKVPLGSSIEDLVRNTQQYQAQLLQFAAENLRRQKWQPVTGIFQFMLVEHWPSMNWGMVDYLRQPKLGYAALARAYQPVLPIAVAFERATALRLFVINDEPVRKPGCVLTVHGIGAGAAPHVFPVDIPADGVLSLDERVDLPDEHAVVTLELRDSAGAVLGRNAYVPGYFKQ